MAFFASRMRWLGRQALVYANLHWRREAYERALSELPRVNGTALVVGSAPQAQRPRGLDASWFRISANASQLVLENFKLPEPELTIFRPNILVEGESQNAYWQVLRNRGTGHLVALIDSENDRRLKELLPEKSYFAQRITEMDYTVRVTIVVEVTGHHLISWWRETGDISNGLFATLLALKLGASKVVMSGFSFADGWSHAPHLNGKRKHLHAEALTCRMIRAKNLPIYSADHEFAERSGLQLWS